MHGGIFCICRYVHEASTEGRMVSETVPCFFMFSNIDIYLSQDYKYMNKNAPDSLLVFFSHRCKQIDLQDAG